MQLYASEVDKYHCLCISLSCQKKQPTKCAGSVRQFQAMTMQVLTGRLRMQVD